MQILQTRSRKELYNYEEGLPAKKNGCFSPKVGVEGLLTILLPVIQSFRPPDSRSFWPVGVSHRMSHVQHIFTWF